MNTPAAPLPGAVRVCVAWSPGPRQVHERDLTLPSGSTVQMALEAAGLPQPPDGRSISIWSRRATLDQPLRDGDRVEVLRPLRVDPKHARRERFGQQGARSAGLFAKRRPGAKPGY